MSATRIRKAVIPAAGLSTRMLPATKSIPKEMLPLVDRPLIHYSVEEAVTAGVREICIVLGRAKAAIEDYFDANPELELELERRGKQDLLNALRQLPTLAELSYVRQGTPRGLGHAVWRARHVVGDVPFVVILPDDVIYGEPSCLQQLIHVYGLYQSPVLALMEVPEEKVSAYGIVAVEPVEEYRGPGKLYRVLGMVEKPLPDQAPSRLAIIGRYVLTPDIFPILSRLEPGAGGEIQLTDAIAQLQRTRAVYGLRFVGQRYDAGDRLGYLMATVEYGLRNSNLASRFQEYLRGVVQEFARQGAKP